MSMSVWPNVKSWNPMYRIEVEILYLQMSTSIRLLFPLIESHSTEHASSDPATELASANTLH